MMGRRLVFKLDEEVEVAALLIEITRET